MKRFLLRILAFSSILLSFYAIVWGYYIWQMHTFSFVLPQEKHILVIGDSQTQAAVDDVLLPQIKNISQSHDNYFTQYRRLQLYVDANQQIDTVFIALTPHTVAVWTDCFLGDFGYIDYAVKYYLPFFSLSEWAQFLRHDCADVVSSLFTPIKFYLAVDSSYIEQMGRFSVVSESHLQQDVASGALRLRRHEESVETNNRVTLTSLHHIADLCSERGIKLIGLNTPVYHADEYLDTANFRKVLTNHFPDIELWDYMRADIPDSFRRDVNHLNRAGANWMTEVLGKRMSLNSKN